jgi:hypothetical protein
VLHVLRGTGGHVGPTGLLVALGRSPNARGACDCIARQGSAVVELGAGRGAAVAEVAGLCSRLWAAIGGGGGWCGQLQVVAWVRKASRCWRVMMRRRPTLR